MGCGRYNGACDAAGEDTTGMQLLQIGNVMSTEDADSFIRRTTTCATKMHQHDEMSPYSLLWARLLGRSGELE